jgi:serine O-acetyltransferase
MNDMSEIAQLSRLSQSHTNGCLPSLRAVKLFLQADLYRYQGSGRFKFWRHFLFTPGFQYTVWMRLTGWAVRRRLTKWTLGIPLKMLLSRCRYKYGIAIPEYTDIGPGLFINRFGGIYINGDAIIGANCNIAQMTIIGQTNRGDKSGSPIIESKCYIAAGACVVGRITIGSESVVANNAVVTKDVPPGSVVGGIPAKVISGEGSRGYVNRAVPDEWLARCRAAQQNRR